VTAVTYDELARIAGQHGLSIYGALHPARTPVPHPEGGTIVLFGTNGSFWELFRHSPEYQDQAPDPIDRWSDRGSGGMADAFGAAAHFPSDGPPYPPFIAWALASGRWFTSPSQMMVHDEVGMLISLRGALHFDIEFDIPPPPLAHSPCRDCTAQPCLSACPVNALVDGGPYQLAACHDHLDHPAGASCMSQGCLARRACPISSGAERPFAQTAHHMRYFHPT
jgi:hypothetical protein